VMSETMLLVLCCGWRTHRCSKSMPLPGILMCGGRGYRGEVIVSLLCTVLSTNLRTSGLPAARCSAGPHDHCLAYCRHVHRPRRCLCAGRRW
jgi:hypothetical protein